MSKAHKQSQRVALGGIVAALCITVMFLSGVLPALYIVAPMVSGMLLLILAEEVSVPWAWLTYAAVSLLSLFVLFDKDAALMFILFFGYYPILRPKLQKIVPKALRIFVKVILFNIFLVLDYLLTVYLLGLPTFEDMGRWALVVMALVFNYVFIMYDVILSRMHWFYLRFFRSKIHPRRNQKNPKNIK